MDKSWARCHRRRRAHLRQYRQPGARSVSGGLLARVDQDFASALLRHVGAGADGPFLAAEVRHLGEAASRDVPGGSAAGGRGALFTLGLIGTNPADFAIVLPDAEARLVGNLAQWLSSEAYGRLRAASPCAPRRHRRAGARRSGEARGVAAPLQSRRPVRRRITLTPLPDPLPARGARGSECGRWSAVCGARCVTSGS